MRTSQTTLELHLPQHIEPRRYIKQMTAGLEPNTEVNLHTNKKPIEFAFPFTSENDFPWYRKDLIWHITTRDPETASQWSYYFQSLEDNQEPEKEEPHSIHLSEEQR